MIGFPPDNSPRLLPADTDAWYEVRVGLPRPDWTNITEWISNQVAEDRRDLAWYQAACDWLRRLGAALGKGYVVHESPVFLMLMSGPDEWAQAMLQLLEDQRKRVSRALGELAQVDYLGKPVAVVLADENDYYSYIADYYPPEGRFAKSGAVFLGRDFGHIVTPCDDPDPLRETIAHETAHNCLMHLPLPLWLNEGLAMMVTRSHSPSLFEWQPHTGGPNYVETIARCRRTWNSATIQRFWSGGSFHALDDTRTFSYLLAADLTRRLSRHREFEAFVLQADHADAGAAAAAEVLGVDLGQAVAEFLGPGAWGPCPKSWEADSPSDPNGR